MSKESVTVAGIDCGTNSIRLKIARVDADGMHEVVRSSRMRSNVSSACAPKSFPAPKKPT